MQGTMMAARIHQGDQEFRVEEVPIPELRTGEVLVKVEATGLTRGVLSLWRNRGRMRVLPTILGYETAGIVVEVGEDVTMFKEGDRVRVHPILSCRNCYYCRTDMEAWCPYVSVIGGAVYGELGMPMYQQYHNGGLAQYMKVPDWDLDLLPESIPFEIGARIHSVAVALRALRLAELNFGETLVVNGATGGVGSAAVKCAPLFGVSKIIAISRRRENLERTKALEPDLVEIIATDALGEDWKEKQLLTEKIRSLTDNKGADAVLDLLPASTDVTIQSTFAMRKVGTTVLAGGNRENLVIPYGEFRINGYQLKASNGYVRRDARELIQLLATHRLDISDLITHRFTLSDVNKAAEVIWERIGDARFVMVNPEV